MSQASLHQDSFKKYQLVGGFKHGFYDFPITFPSYWVHVIIPTDFHSIIFQRGRSTINQITIIYPLVLPFTQLWKITMFHGKTHILCLLGISHKIPLNHHFPSLNQHFQQLNHNFQPLNHHFQHTNQTSANHQPLGVGGVLGFFLAQDIPLGSSFLAPQDHD